jgi:hypothetical protein
MKYTVGLFRETRFQIDAVDAVTMEEAIAKCLGSAEIGLAKTHNCEGIFIAATVEMSEDEQHAAEKRSFLLDGLGGITKRSQMVVRP